MSGASVPLLLVDDEEGIRIVLSALLEDMGYKVTTAADGDEALAIFRKTLPPLVVTDIKMSGMDGIVLLKELKRISPGVEVLMLTGHGDMELAVTSLRFGAGDFLNKPVSADALEVALNRAKERMALREALRRHTEDLEKLVEERTRELVRSERFAAVGETAAGLAHAIKNIAGALEGTMYVLEKAIEQNNREHLEEGWQVIRADISRLYDLSMGMLDLGRPLRLDFRPVVPGDLARKVLELMGTKAREAGVRLEIADEGGREPVLMAEEPMHQCLLNLVLNALEAFEPGSFDSGVPGFGTFGLGAGTSEALESGLSFFAPPGVSPQAGEDGSRREPPVVIVTVAWEENPRGKSSLYYAVCDNGPGIPDDMRENLGESFRSGKKGGSGIGLFATRRIVHEMGGELRFTTQVGQGTEARLLLPGKESIK